MSCCCCLGWIVGGLIGIYFLGKFLMAKWKASKNEKLLERWGRDKTPKDVVILHQFPRGKTVPSMSPFVLKMETYLRMAGIKYEVDIKDYMSTKGKSPWISLNGEHVADSEFIIEFLAKKFEKNFSKNIDKKTLAVAVTSKLLLDEYFYWGLVLERYVFGGLQNLHKYMRIQFPSPIFWLAKKYMRHLMSSRANGQGIGRHSEKEIVHLMSKNLRALSTILDQQKFICGNEPCEEDCGIFGELAQIVWTFPGSEYDKLLKGELNNLEKYCYRMKEKFWPDWDQVVS